MGRFIWWVSGLAPLRDIPKLLSALDEDDIVLFKSNKEPEHAGIKCPKMVAKINGANLAGIIRRNLANANNSISFDASIAALEMLRNWLWDVDIFDASRIADDPSTKHMKTYTWLDLMELSRMYQIEALESDLHMNVPLTPKSIAPLMKVAAKMNYPDVVRKCGKYLLTLANDDMHFEYWVAGMCNNEAPGSPEAHSKEEVVGL